LLCPELKFESFEFAKTYIKPICRIVQMPGVSFRGFLPGDLPVAGLNIYAMLQPDFTNLMELKETGCEWKKYIKISDKKF
jgi:hypothetical protein